MWPMLSLLVVPQTPSQNSSNSCSRRCSRRRLDGEPRHPAHPLQRAPVAAVGCSTHTLPRTSCGLPSS
jgi:hypothetical protein